jgi:hypothetical protein
MVPLLLLLLLLAYYFFDFGRDDLLVVRANVASVAGLRYFFCDE